jgi:hypothetical protein
MTRIFAVGLLLLSFTSLAVADGPDIPPAQSNTATTIHAVRMADGPDIPPMK